MDGIGLYIILKFDFDFDYFSAINIIYLTKKQKAVQPKKIYNAIFL